MKNSFLIGSFLAGRESVFKHNIPGGIPTELEPEDLSHRFDERATHLRQRRVTYRVGLQMSAVIALVLVFSGFRISFSPDAAFTTPDSIQEMIVMEDIEQTRQIPKPPPPPRPPVPIEVPDDEILEDEELAIDAEIDFDAPIELPPPPPAKVEDEPEPDIFVVVEDMPQMVGGFSKMMRDVVYPEMARLADLEGTVVVQVVIDVEGRPTKPEVIKSAHKLLDKAAIEALMKQRFIPGKQRGRTVPVLMAVPVAFKLIADDL